MAEAVWQVAVTVCIACLVVTEAVRLLSRMSAKKRAEKGRHADRKAHDGKKRDSDL